MERSRTTYSAKEKMDIVLSILSKKSTIQTISQEKGIAATLISLWKKQAVDAMAARLQPQPRGRRKGTQAAAEQQPAASPAPELKAARHELRAAKIRAAHLERSLAETREKLARVQEQLGGLASVVGCKLVAEVKPRAARKPRKA